jgi:lipoprotein-anchoring transpeptidase ErfK/SrfK
MKRMFVSLAVALLVFVGLHVPAVYAQGGGSYVVRPGDTLSSIATSYGLSTAQLASVNGLSHQAWVYAGQSLTIPTVGAEVSQAAGQGGYTVQRGDTLQRIAQVYGTTTAALQAANGLNNANFVYVGQQLVIPGGSAVYTPQASYAAPVSSGGERWIDVNLSNQTVTAYEGQTPVYSALASTGTWQYPTVVGTFSVYVKYAATRMYGGYGADTYDLPNVPYVMYFYGGYGLHGTYWHNNFGTPMSHGCVNLSTPDAQWFYNWASVGTKVVSHY